MFIANIEIKAKASCYMGPASLLVCYILYPRGGRDGRGGAGPPLVEGDE